MFQKLGSRKYVVPVLAAIAISCVMALMFYPMIAMSPKELPFAVLSLDEGATTPAGEMNVGEQMVAGLVDAEVPDGTTAPIMWHLVETQEELDTAIADNEYFGALTIPADFTHGQVLAQTGEGEAPSVSVVLDNAKSPMIATQMQSAIGTMLTQFGVSADVQLIHTGSATRASASPTSGMITQQITVMPLVIMSLMGGVLITRIFPKSEASTTAGRFAVLGKRLAYAVGLSLVAALVGMWLLNTIAAAAAPFWTAFLFLWFASFSVMTVFIGAFSIGIPVGALVAVCVMALGTMTAALPAEVLPSFWADWVYPWAPQHFMGNGIRDILYMGAGLMPKGSAGLLGHLIAGLALIGLAGLIPSRTAKSEPVGEIEVLTD